MLGAILPVGAAVLFILFSPLLTSKVVSTVEGWLAKDATAYGVASEAEVPPHLSKDAIVDYVEYGSDAAQLVPATLMPIIGAIFAVASDRRSLAAVVTLVLFIAAAVFLDSWILSRAPQDYVSRKVRGGYSIVSLVALTCNFAGIVIIVTF